MKTCRGCGGYYRPYARAQRYCSGCRPDVSTCEWCSTEFNQPRRKPKRFCSKSCANSHSARRGDQSPFFKGSDGLYFNNGRWWIVCRDGHNITYARALMCGHLKRMLGPSEIVHHLNGDRTDDRVENLGIVTRAHHAWIHKDEITAARKAVGR